MSSRRAGHSASRRRNRPEPEILSARRPAAPPSEPPPALESSPAVAPEGDTTGETPADDKPRASRAARIVSTEKQDPDARRVERERLLGRLLSSEGRGAVTRAADLYVKAGFDFPVEQPVQLQLLEHYDEGVVRSAIEALRASFTTEPPLKRPILEQRLRRLEDGAEEEPTRLAASELRRVLRT